MSESVVRLSNGVRMPMMALGTYLLDGKQTVKVVLEALKLGYRKIDTAALYDNEESIGVAIRQSGIPRQDVFVTTKMWWTAHGSKQSVRAAVDSSLQKLGLDYIDLYLIHWPDVPRSATESLPKRTPKQIRAETWSVLESLVSEGKIRTIGVSNYTIRHLTELLETCRIKPAVNQVEFHPRLYQQHLLSFCQQHNIVLEAYASLGKHWANSALSESPLLHELAHKYKKTLPQILLRWAIQHGVPVLPKSTKSARMKENADMFSWSLTPHDLARMDALHVGQHTSWDPRGVK